MECNSRAESRFCFCHYYFYIGGIPLFNNSVYIFCHTFVLLCYVCAYSTIFSMFMDLYYHIEDMDVVMLLLLFPAAGYTQLAFGVTLVFRECILIYLCHAIYFRLPCNLFLLFPFLLTTCFRPYTAIIRCL
jgi:hypothetical protein